MSLTVHLTVALFGGAAPNPQPTATPAATEPANFLGMSDSAWVTFCFFAAVVGGYFVSLILHPNHKCPRCKGTGRHIGSIYTYASRPCTKCKGRSVEPRLGRRVFFKQAT